MRPNQRISLNLKGIGAHVGVKKLLTSGWLPWQVNRVFGASRRTLSTRIMLSHITSLSFTTAIESRINCLRAEQRRSVLALMNSRTATAHPCLSIIRPAEMTEVRRRWVSRKGSPESINESDPVLRNVTAGGAGGSLCSRLIS